MLYSTILKLAILATGTNHEVVANCDSLKPLFNPNLASQYHHLEGVSYKRRKGCSSKARGRVRKFTKSRTTIAAKSAERTNATWKASNPTNATAELEGVNPSNKTDYSADSSRAATRTTASAVLGLAPDALQSGGVFFGLLPDEGVDGGSRETMADLNAALGGKSATYGWYAQAKSGIPFDGSQLLSVMNDIKACNCVFQPAVMPTGGWKGLTKSDNSQAVAIANVMKKFTDQGIPVWLRFAHEMNYYQTEGTYSGTADDFKAGWAAVSAACKQIAPDVKMWWTPNVASPENYAEYAPTDMSTVDLVGIDYYPKALRTGTEFVDTMKSFHDTYAVDGRFFAIGETGLGFAGSPSDRVAWHTQVMAAKPILQNYISSSWFNYQKEYDYRIITTAQASITIASKRILT